MPLAWTYGSNFSAMPLIIQLLVFQTFRPRPAPEFGGASGKFDGKMLGEVEKFMNDPAGWSKAHGGVATAAE